MELGRHEREPDAGRSGELALPVAAADLVAFLTHVQNDPSLYPQYGFPLLQYSEVSTIVNAAGEIVDRTL